jgi:hypothetical protein
VSARCILHSKRRTIAIIEAKRNTMIVAKIVFAQISLLMFFLRRQMHLTLDCISPMASKRPAWQPAETLSQLPRSGGDFADADESIEHRPIVAPDDECPCLVALEGRLRLSGTAGALPNPFARF